MDQLKILKRAFDITRVYRALWIFGIIVALTVGGPSSGGGGGNSGARGIFNPGDPTVPTPPAPPQAPELPELPELPDFPQPNFQFDESLIPWLIAGAVLIVLLGITLTVLRYVSSVALIRMTDLYETDGKKLKVGEGFRLGWSHYAGRLFGIDLAIFFPTFFGFLLLFAIAGSPFLLLLTQQRLASVLGVILGLLLLFLAILIAIAAGIILSVLQQLAYRAGTMENLGALESLNRAWQRMRNRSNDIAKLWLILFGIWLLWGIGVLLAAGVLIFAALIVGGIPAALVGLIASLFMAGRTPWILALIVGAIIALLAIAIPIIVARGIFETFHYNVWTLAYRELMVGEGLSLNLPPTPPAPLNPQPPAPAETPAL